RENLNELTYPATLAGLHFDIQRSGRGLQLRTQGFDGRQQLLLEELLRELRRPELAPALFERIRGDYLRELQNGVQRPPYALVVEGLADLLLRAHWPDAELAAQLGDISLEELRAFAADLLA